ncbi:hypothetical protein JOF36_004069 [Pseudonocardia parietis]|uniref:Uncharacterized protein n=1 Tax=Pseudonocardia parietis TaxID=570936 RepID=A0ABS4VWS8_9PSEU|nr:hypothetical protein [Pseudonocardia parietis]
MEQHERQHHQRRSRPPNSTPAIGSPLARDFLDPQNTIAIRSASLNPSALDPSAVTASTMARSSRQAPSSTPSETGVSTPDHRPRGLPREERHE